MKTKIKGERLKWNKGKILCYPILDKDIKGEIVNEHPNKEKEYIIR